MNEDKIINKLIKIEQKLNTDMVTKDDLRTLEARIATQLDQQSVILTRLNEARLFAIEWVRRIETDIERIKAHLQIAERTSRTVKGSRLGLASHRYLCKGDSGGSHVRT